MPPLLKTPRCGGSLRCRRCTYTPVRVPSRHKDSYYVLIWLYVVQPLSALNGLCRLVLTTSNRPYWPWRSASKYCEPQNALEIPYIIIPHSGAGAGPHKLIINQVLLDADCVATLYYLAWKRRGQKEPRAAILNDSGDISRMPKLT